MELFINEQKIRLVPFQRKTKATLRKYISIHGDVEGEDKVFLTIDNIPMSTRNVQERIQDHGKLANIQGVRVSPHTFRHTPRGEGESVISRSQTEHPAAES